jgi:hypothetical protein
MIEMSNMQQDKVCCACPFLGTIVVPVQSPINQRDVQMAVRLLDCSEKICKFWDGNGCKLIKAADLLPTVLDALTRIETILRLTATKQ